MVPSVSLEPALEKLTLEPVEPEYGPLASATGSRLTEAVVESLSVPPSVEVASVRWQLQLRSERQSGHQIERACFTLSP